MIKSYKELLVWKKGIELTKSLYKITSGFPKSELFGLTSQIRRASVAISSNIAEGYCRGHRLEYVQFLNISYGSVAELETQLYISFELGYINKADFDKISSELEEISKMLKKLILKLRFYPKP